MAVELQQSHLAKAVVNLDAWLQTMRQESGYGGPVAHWWQDQFLYTGPGLDWRYEGILVGYTELLQKTGNPLWLERIKKAQDDLIRGQMESGSYMMSEFERNPGTLGTPHEAAASLGLLKSYQITRDERVLITARRNLSNLVKMLWDPQKRGFNDRPGIPGRVPNKLATFGHALCVLSEQTHEDQWLDYAKAAIDDVLRFQVLNGPFRGAIHQYAPDTEHGDERFFPFYNARCVEPLIVAAEVFGHEQYLEAAHDIIRFLQRSMTPEGQWPQICYLSGQRAEYPRWIAGTADILHAFHVMQDSLPQQGLKRLLDSQLPSGGFPTGIGFARKTNRYAPLDPPDYRDITPVTGWNDKVLRLLVALTPSSTDDLSEPRTKSYSRTVSMEGKTIVFTETANLLGYGDHVTLNKSESWARYDIL